MKELFMTNCLVVYFSASGVTQNIAQKLAEAIDCNVYEIRPKEPYTNADLNWMDANSRSSIEMKDFNSRPEIVDTDVDIEQYDTVFLGFPIWWYIAPTIVNTFLEKYDFSNKKIILFATSGGSGFGGTVKNIRKSVDESTEIVEGKLFNSGVSVEDLRQWAQSLL
jgi:flavodoxin